MMLMQNDGLGVINFSMEHMFSQIWDSMQRIRSNFWRCGDDDVATYAW